MFVTKQLLFANETNQRLSVMLTIKDIVLCFQPTVLFSVFYGMLIYPTMCIITVEDSDH